MFENREYNKEKTHNASAQPVEQELCAKYVFDVIPMGEDGGSIYDIPPAKYTDSEIASLKPIRDAVCDPDKSTIMQKIVSEATLQKHYLQVPTDSMMGVKVIGMVAKAKDIVAFTQTPSECYTNCRLDYQGTEFTNPQVPVYAIRFRAGSDENNSNSVYYIPYSSEFTKENSKSLPQPFTGSGYIGSKKYVIPEYRIVSDDGIYPDDGVIYKIFPDGHEELYAVYDYYRKVFIRKMEGK